MKRSRSSSVSSNSSCSRRITKRLSEQRIRIDLKTNNELCDGTIICSDNVEIKIHRLLLASVSSYFKAFFTNTLGAVPESTEARVSVPSIIFTKIVNYSYTGNCEIEDETVELLLQAADQYLVEGIKQLCCRYILDQLKATNCLEILRLARRYFCSDLEKKSKSYVRQNFVALLNEGHEFETLNINEVVEILEDDELNVRNEEFVYKSAQKWVNFNLEDRKVYLLRLLKCIRLVTLSDYFFSTNILNWNLIIESHECLEYLDVIKTYKQQNIDIDNPLIGPRVPYDTLFAVGGWNYENVTNSMETYDTRAQRWVVSTDTDTIPRSDHGLCALNGCLYMIGGVNADYLILNTVRCFDPITHKWTDRACMHYPRWRLSVVTLNNTIYAMGGMNEHEVLSSVERYDPENNRWELTKAMQTARYCASAAVLHDKIYIVGGSKKQEFLRSAEVYDVCSNQWTFIHSMLSPRCSASLVSVKNTLYAIGGYNGRITFNTAEKCTPGMSQGWSPIADMLSQREDFGAVVLNEQIFAIGGQFQDRTLNNVECYDTVANEWSAAASTNMSQSYVRACILSGLPNAREYSFLGRVNAEVGQGAPMHQD